MKRFLCAVCFLTLACTARPGLDGVTPTAKEVGSGLPRGFLLGAATSSHQVEGGLSNDWTDWEAGKFPDGKPHIHNNDQSGAAADSWNLFDEDLKALQQAGAKSYRLSVEWSRIEPVEGQYDAAALARYHGWLVKLRAAGIEPMVTVFHFTLPKWVAAKGGFEQDAILEDFARFSTKVGEALGDQVDLWCTINEPNVYAVQGYLGGVWPPGKKDDVKGQTLVIANMLKAHGRSAAALRAADTIDADGDGKATVITIAHHVRAFQAASQSALDGFITGVTDDYFNEAIVRAIVTGRILLSVPGTIEIDETVPGLKGSVDAIGINYYTRYFIRADLGEASLSRQYYLPGRPTTDLGWDIYPDGLYQALVRFSSYKLPLYITENGLADTDGKDRATYLLKHLEAIRRAVKDGADVKGYFHWSLIDNFEWADGFEPRFGLFSVDYASPLKTRTATQAVATFKEVADNIPK